MGSAKLLGFGLLIVGSLTAASAAGYLALRPAELEIPQAVVVEAEKPGPVAATPVPAKALPSQKSTPRGAKAETETEPALSAPPAPAPVATQTEPPSVEAPQSAPPPVVVDPPRYVPEAPVPAAAVVPEPARIEFQELTVEKHSVIGIRLDAAVSTRTARVEDRVSATVSRDVTVGGRTAVAAGVRLEGIVTLVERGGRFKNRPRLGLRFERMILADGTRVPIKTDTIYREGDSPTADSTAKVGAGAVAGAILGAVFGGKKGAAIGTAAGAAGGAAAVMRADPGEVSLPAGAPLTVRLSEDVTITINR